MLNASISGLRSFSALTWVAIGLSMGRREDFRGKILVRGILGVMGSLFLGSGHSQHEKVLLWIFVAWESYLMWTAISFHPPKKSDRCSM
jgi:hypothetical protein